MFSVTPELYATVSLAVRWLFAFFALMLLLFALSWHHSARKEQRERFRNLPGAGNVGELLVLSGSDELRPETWFPVPREGILGSLRSCDLVIPCPGVRSQHLDFSWQDGTGLLIRPRTGCEVLVDGVPVGRRDAADGVPLLHGTMLQVGTAVLRLQLFAALSDINRSFAPVMPSQAAPGTSWMPPSQPVSQPSPDAYRDPAFRNAPLPPENGQVLPYPAAAPEEQQLPPYPAVAPEAPAVPDPSRAPQQPPQRRKRADRWKEDWSE